MTTNEYERTVGEFRRILAGVPAGGYEAPTPCASFNVAQLIDHTIATQRMVTAALRDRPFNMAGVEVAPGEQVETFDRAAAEAVGELRVDGAMEKVVDLPFGSFSGEELMGLAALDTFQHAWDLARATGQSTDLPEDLTDAMTVIAVSHMEHAPRGDEPAPYGPEQEAPEGASHADRLAAFLGREV